MNTTENNKIIAEFLGWDKCIYQQKITNPKHPLYKVEQPKIKVFCLERHHHLVEAIYTDCPGYEWNYEKEVDRLMFFEQDLKFHLDWNWLMEIVEKIEIIKIETYKVRVDIYLNCCQISPTHWQKLISIYGDKETKIQTVYNACIEFINWYNKQK